MGWQKGPARLVPRVTETLASHQRVMHERMIRANASKFE